MPLTINPADVEALAGATFCRAPANEPVKPGQPCFMSGNGISLTDANAPARYEVCGLAVNEALKAGQMVTLVTTGPVQIGAGVQGTAYYAGAAPGTVVTEAELTSASKTLLLGFGDAGGVLQVQATDTGISRA